MEDLHLERFFLWLDSSGGEGLGGQARLYVKSLLDNAAEDIGHKIVVLTEQLGTNVRIFYNSPHVSIHVWWPLLIAHWVSPPPIVQFEYKATAGRDGKRDG